MNLAVSKNANPSTSSSSDWYFYRFNVTLVQGTSRYGIDYPGFGFDDKAIYITFNMYPLPLSGSPKNCQIIVASKDSAIGGNLSYLRRIYTPDGIDSSFTLQPATVISSSTPGNKSYFGETRVDLTNIVRIWSLNDPIGNPILTSWNITVPNHGGFITNAPQLGTAIPVATLSPRTQGNAFWYNGQLWFCHTAGGGSGRSKIYYYKVNTNNFPVNPPTLGESGYIDGGEGVWTYQPSIGGNQKGDVCIVYTQSANTKYPEIMFTTRLASGSSFDVPKILKSSDGFSNSDRWGDYASVTPDPSDSSFWITHEWARSSSAHDWGTWWGNILPYSVPNLQFVSTEVSGGNGNAKVDYNECNELFVTIQNLGDLMAENVTATLSTSSPEVTITQNTSSYPNIDIGAAATNNTVFRVSTSPNFICGSAVMCTLYVTYTGGSTALYFNLASGTIGYPIEFMYNTPTPIPDPGTVDIPITVSGVTDRKSVV